jgi:IPT/TIG domain
MSTPAPNQPAPSAPKTAEELRKEREERLRKQADEEVTRKWQLLLGVMYVLLPFFLIYLLFAVFPPYPWPSDPNKDVQGAAVKADTKAKNAESRATDAEAKAVEAEAAVKAAPAGADADALKSKATAARENADKLRDEATKERNTADEARVESSLPKKYHESYPIKFLWMTRTTSLEERLLLLVIVMGAIGSYIHASTSFADFTGNRQFARSWTAWYLLRPFIGVGLALVIYAAVRGGLLSMVMSGAVEAGDINPFGVAALAGLTGMFSKQAGDKLNEVFSTLFKSAGDDHRKDSLAPAPAPEVKVIEPKKGSTAGGTPVVITGTGFLDKATVTFDGVDATSIEVDKNKTTIKAVTPAHEKAGPVDVEVINEDGKKGTLKGGYTYEDGAGNGDNNGAEGGAGSTVEEGDTEEGSVGAAVGEQGSAQEGSTEEGGMEEGAEGEAVNGAEQLAPTIDSITPDSGPLKGMGAIEIVGTNISEGAAVMVGGKAAILVDASVPDSITVIVPPADKAGPVDVFITNTDGQSATKTGGYTYTA